MPFMPLVKRAIFYPGTAHEFIGLRIAIAAHLPNSVPSHSGDGRAAAVNARSIDRQFSRFREAVLAACKQRSQTPPRFKTNGSHEIACPKKTGPTPQVKPHPTNGNGRKWRCGSERKPPNHRSPAAAQMPIRNPTTPPQPKGTRHKQFGAAPRKIGGSSTGNRRPDRAPPCSPAGHRPPPPPTILPRHSDKDPKPPTSHRNPSVHPPQ